MDSTIGWLLDELRSATSSPVGPIAVTGRGSLPSVHSVTELAVATIGAAAAGIAGLAATLGGTEDPTVSVDRAAASAWFGIGLEPIGWTLPPVWDPIAGDYRTADGWIRLHTNAVRHRAAALTALGADPADPVDRDDVAATVRRWTADELERAVVKAGGCAAAMRSADEWRAHPQGNAVALEPLVWREPVAPTPGRWTGGPPHRPLAGLRVLDLTRVLAGPVATRFLAAFGADVLRIDPPGWEEASLEPEVTLGKRCGRLDLRSDAGRDAFGSLLASADVLVHGYRSDALDGLGFGRDQRRAINAGLVDVSLDAYGWSGPWQRRRGFDSLVQMSCGIAHAGGAARGVDQPVPLPVQALDHATGYLLAAVVVDAVRRRLATGAAECSRTSLARMAVLLQSAPPGSLEPEPLSPVIRTEEQSPWGPARRVVPPATITGVPMRWDLGVGPLGSTPSPFSWLS